VPDECELVLDRRLLPGERVSDVVATLESRLRNVVPAEIDLELSRMTRGFEPSEIVASSSFATRLVAAVEETGGPPCALAGMPYASDVSELILGAGIEAVTFGPGSAAFAHSADERVPLVQVQQAARAIARVALDLLA
jgi:acetylornithine deacetylase/succinyl-diaminopimelate desuccinylase-like protein